MKAGDLVRVKDDLIWSPSLRNRTLVFLRPTRLRSITVNGATRGGIQMGEFLRWDGTVVELDVAMFEPVQTEETV